VTDESLIVVPVHRKDFRSFDAYYTALNASEAEGERSLAEYLDKKAEGPEALAEYLEAKAKETADLADVWIAEKAIRVAAELAKGAVEKAAKKSAKKAAVSKSTL
jgi:hypothetical protein